MDGLLLVDKPKGWTSFDVVNKVRRVVETSGLNKTGKKRHPVGHTGTLDPLATGLLVLVVGKYTKRAQEFTKLDKTYEVTMKLGYTSTTGDEEGDKTKVNASYKPPKDKIIQTLSSFKGEIEQIPPAHSAVKVGGKRAYKLARQGKEVKLEPRKIKIYEIYEVSYEYPLVRFSVRVSSGTYIRTLVEDIGAVLGTGAHTTSLRRISVSGFNVSDALNIKDLSAELIEVRIQKISSD